MRKALVILGALGACRAFQPKTPRQAQGARRAISLVDSLPLTHDAASAMGVSYFLRQIEKQKKAKLKKWRRLAFPSLRGRLTQQVAQHVKSLRRGNGDSVPDKLVCANDSSGVMDDSVTKLRLYRRDFTTAGIGWSEFIDPHEPGYKIAPNGEVDESYPKPLQKTCNRDVRIALTLEADEDDDLKVFQAGADDRIADRKSIPAEAAAGWYPHFGSFYDTDGFFQRYGAFRRGGDGLCEEFFGFKDPFPLAMLFALLPDSAHKTESDGQTIPHKLKADVFDRMGLDTVVTILVTFVKNLRAEFENYYSAPRYDTSNEDGAPGYLAGFLKKAMEGRLQKPLEFGRNDKKVFEFLQGLPASFKTILWRRAVWYNYIAKLQK